MQKASLPFVMTTQVFSPPVHFRPVSSGVAAFMVSILSFRLNSMVSPLAIPSNVSVLPPDLTSTAYLSPFLVTFSEESLRPGQAPSRAVSLADGAAGAFGSTDGETDGLTLGAGDAGAAGLGAVLGAGFVVSVG